MATAAAPAQVAIECPGCNRSRDMLRVALTPVEQAWPDGYMAAPALKARLREQQQRLHPGCWPTDTSGEPLGLT